jgi:hypothetical protein
VPANLSKPFSFVGSFSLGAPAQVVPNVTAVDEIVAYIQSKGTISPVIDNRTVQLDTAPTNVSDIH